MHGIFLRLTHAGASAGSVYVADLEAVPTRVPTKQPGPVYVPVGGHVDVVFTSPVALSYESGNIRKFIVRGLITAAFVFGDDYSASLGQVMRQPFVASPGNAIIETFWLPYPVRIWGIQCYSEVTPATAGAYTLTVASGGNPLVLGGTFDLTSLPPQIVTDVPLTATSAHLEVPLGVPVQLTVASTVGDLVGDGLVIQVLYGLR